VVSETVASCGAKFSLCIEPAPVGYYKMPGSVVFVATERPSRWHQFWVRVFFGWRWIDE
jgi:hypothetical protein